MLVVRQYSAFLNSRRGRSGLPSGPGDGLRGEGRRDRL